jgi:outer membrane murein-binding lipoprotein Lpp
VPSAPARRSRVYYVVAALFVVNAALVAGAIRLHLVVKRDHAPIAAMSAEVTELQADQAGVHVKLEESRAQLEATRTRLEETRTRLDEQATALAAAEQRQKDAERDARERDARDARELAALNARVNRTDRHAYKLDEAIKLIDLVQGRPSAPPSGTTEERVVPIVNP